MAGIQLRTKEESEAYIAGMRRGGQLALDCVRLFTEKQDAEERFNELLEIVERTLNVPRPTP